MKDAIDPRPNHVPLFVLAIPLILFILARLILGAIHGREELIAERLERKLQCERALGIRLISQDEIVDWDAEGLVDARSYMKWRLSSQSYERAISIARDNSTPCPMKVTFPWSIPQENERFGTMFGKYRGRDIVFCPNTREVYIGFW